MSTAYQDYVISLTPNHYWKLEVDSADSGFGAALTTPVPTNTGVFYDGTAITVGSANCARFVDKSLDYGDSADINVTGNPWFRRSYSMWAQADSFEKNFMLYSEGGGVRNMTTMFALGGTVQYICDNDADSNPGCPWSQSVVSPKVKLDTPYHIGMVWESDRVDTGPDGKGRTYMRCYLNGRMIGEKEIFKWDTTNNEEILSEPGGQLNGHSGNVVLGLGRTIIVSKQNFTPSNLSGLMSDVVIWDNVLISDDQMWELFKRGAKDTTATVTLTNLENGTEVRLFENSGALDEIGIGVENSSTNSYSIDYTVASTIDVRMVIIAPGKEVFSKVITLPREDSEINAGLLLDEDRNYRNP